MFDRWGPALNHCKIREQPLPKLLLEGSNSCVRLPASRSTRSHSEVAAGVFDLLRLFPQKILQTRWWRTWLKLTSCGPVLQIYRWDYRSHRWDYQSHTVSQESYFRFPWRFSITSTLGATRSCTPKTVWRRRTPRMRRWRGRSTHTGCSRPGCWWSSPTSSPRRWRCTGQPEEMRGGLSDGNMSSDNVYTISKTIQKVRANNLVAEEQTRIVWWWGGTSCQAWRWLLFVPLTWTGKTPPYLW